MGGLDAGMAARRGGSHKAHSRWSQPTHAPPTRHGHHRTAPHHMAPASQLVSWSPPGLQCLAAAAGWWLRGGHD